VRLIYVGAPDRDGAMNENRFLAWTKSNLLAGIVALAAACAVAGCSGGTDDDALDSSGDSEGALVGPEKDDEVSQAAWSNVGYGVDAKELNGGSNVLIVYGGYSAQTLYVKRWADELFRAKGTDLQIGHLYAVRGPNQAGYQNREIQNSKLAAHLGTNGRAANASSIVIVAHSSGTFVAAELLAMLRNNRGGVPSDTLGKVTVFNLDGGGGVPESTLEAMAHAYFVYACDNNIGRCSHNASTMKSLGNAYASLGGKILVNANGSGCSAGASGGLWCLHDTLITNKPHNSSMYDLERDYTDFTGSRHVITSYLDVLGSP
jgi:hypothetical protein